MYNHGYNHYYKAPVTPKKSADFSPICAVKKSSEIGKYVETSPNDE